MGATVDATTGTASTTVTKQKTTIYILVSLLLAFGGIILLAFVSSTTIIAIATSIIAGAISSVGLAIIRYFDDVTISETSATIARSIAVLDENVNRLDTGLDTIRAVAALTGGPDQRRVFERHPKIAVQHELQSAHRRDVELDAIGMSLQPLFDDIVRELLNRENVRVRLLVQDPLAESFARICSEQGRDRNKTAESIFYTIRMVLEHQSTAREGSEAIIEVRCIGASASVTLTRVNKVVFVRPRILNEANFAGAVFYERYDERVEPRCYDAYWHYFQNAWVDSRVPKIDDIRRT
jgi:hypothetical protein